MDPKFAKSVRQKAGRGNAWLRNSCLLPNFSGFAQLKESVIASIENRRRMVLDDEIFLLAVALDVELGDLIPTVAEVNAERKRLKEALIS